MNFHGVELLDDTILGHAASDVKYSAMLGDSCVCGWSNDAGECVIPPGVCEGVVLPENDGDLKSSWDALCVTGKYTTRESVFDVLQALHVSTTYETTWFSDCVDDVPSVVWGLLSPEEQHDWYAGTYDFTDRGVDVQYLATRGPSGLRIGLVGRNNNSLLEYLQSHRLYQREPDMQPWNSKYRHTIAQPV